MAYRSSLLSLLIFLLLFSLCGCSKSASTEAVAINDSDWIFTLQFQDMTQEDLESELLSRGWVCYQASSASDGYCYLGTLFGTKSTIFYAVDADTSLITKLKISATQYTSEYSAEMEETLAALNDDEWNNVRSAQPWEGTESAPIIVSWITAVRESLARAGAVLPEDAQKSLPTEDAALLEAFEVFDTEYYALGFASLDRSEGRYQLPNDRYADISVSGLPQENGTAGSITFGIRLYSANYVDENGVPLEYISVP